MYNDIYTFKPLSNITSIHHTSSTHRVGVFETNTTKTAAYAAVAPSSSWIVNLKAANEQMNAKTTKKSDTSKSRYLFSWMKDSATIGAIRSIHPIKEIRKRAM